MFESLSVVGIEVILVTTVVPLFAPIALSAVKHKTYGNRLLDFYNDDVWSYKVTPAAAGTATWLRHCSNSPVLTCVVAEASHAKIAQDNTCAVLSKSNVQYTSDRVGGGR